jgi:hypothetical protein
MVWAASPLGARAYGQPLGLCLGSLWETDGCKSTIQCTVTSTCRAPGHLSFGYNTRLHYGRSPTCINRAVGSLQGRPANNPDNQTNTTPMNTWFSTRSRYWHLPQSFRGTWGLPLSHSACNPYCRHLGASNTSLIPPLLEVGPCDGDQVRESRVHVSRHRV